jgi:alkylhydroperoxidase family enzyme
LARRQGATDEVLDALQDRGAHSPPDRLEPGWRAALAYADAVHRSGHDVSDTLFAELAAHWDEGAIVEITLVIGMTEYFNRFNDALAVEPTR